MKKNSTGITLIALVVTIVVLLILAGTSISMLVGENGIITQASLAKKMTQVGNEREGIQIIMQMHYLDEDNEKYNIGTQLYSRNLTNGNKWSIIITKDPKETYGDGWTYISKGTDLLDYGETQYGWLYNQETGETIQLEKDNYVELAYGSNLAVTDGLIFNLDPLNMEDSDSWGETQLYGFSGTETDEDGNVISGFSGSDFNFDGVDDYIEINSDADFSEDGLTIEMYGKIDEKNISLGAFYKGPESASKYAFKYGIGYGTGTCDCTQGMNKLMLLGTFYQGIATGSKYQCDTWSNDFHIFFDDEGYQGGEGYVTFSLKDNGSFYVLLDGKKVAEDKFDSDYVDHYKEYLSNKNYSIIIGKNAIADKFEYISMKTYAIRIYNKALSEEEAIENYNKTVASRIILENE